MPQWLRKLFKILIHHNMLTAYTLMFFAVWCVFVFKSTEPDKIGTIASMATALAIIIAMIQLLASNRQHRDNAKRAAAEKAVEIARYFQSSVVHSMSFLTVTLRMIGQTKYEQNDRLENGCLRFTKDELAEIFGQSEENEYSAMQDKITAEVLTQAATVAARVQPAPDKQLTVVDYINLRNEFDDRRLDMLNTLEWIAMTLRTGVADERIVYQSLHQVMLRYIRLEYACIALYNTDKYASGQYYTNLIWLYNTWQGRKAKSQKVDEKNAAKRERLEKRMFEKNMQRRNKNVNCPPPL